MIRELVLSATINFDKKMLEAIFDWSQIGRWSRSFIKYFVLLQRKYSYTGIAYRVMTLTEKDAKILKAKKILVLKGLSSWTKSEQSLKKHKDSHYFKRESKKGTYIIFAKSEVRGLNFGRLLQDKKLIKQLEKLSDTLSFDPDDLLDYRSEEEIIVKDAVLEYEG